MTRARRPLPVLALAGLALGACSKSKPTVEVRVAGSSTVYARMIEPLGSTLEKYARLRVSPDIRGTGAGFISLLEGRTDVLFSSAELPVVINAARALGWKGSNTEAKGLYVARIHEERIIVVVNADNPVNSVSAGNLVKIMSGQITNWKEVGGEDLPIMVVVPEPGRATREVFARQVMKGVPFAKGAFDRQPTGKADDIVRVNASAIAVTAEAFFHPAHLKILDTTKVTRPLLFITRGRPTGPAAQLIDFVNGLGRRYWQFHEPQGFWERPPD